MQEKLTMKFDYVEIRKVANGYYITKQDSRCYNGVLVCNTFEDLVKILHSGDITEPTTPDKIRSER